MKQGPPDNSNRFGLLRLFMLLLGLVLVARVVHVQVIQHEMYKEIADRQWTKPVSLPAERGNLFDRNGRPLALSVDRWKVGVARSLVEDPQKLAALLAPILDLNENSLAKKLAAGNSHIVLRKKLVLSREEKISLEAQKAVTLKDMRSRIYPCGEVGASVVGFFNHGEEGDVATGLELGLDNELAGTPGRARVIRRAGSSEDLGQVVLERPTHGNSLVLTLDADLQAICERRLAEAIKDKNAKGGSVLITDPFTGDILAAASWPLLESRQGSYDDSRLWQNRNFTSSFEPGSVFKIFSTASLMRNAAIDTATIFDCSNDDFGSFRIRNDDNHKYGFLPLMRAFTKSSNIYFARAAGNMTNKEFYRDLVDFGFGQKTTLPYPGQNPGILHPPTLWSGRSRPTIAIGQEIAVTPLQLAMACGAVANGGTLYAPRLVRERRDIDDRPLQVKPAVALRRIMTEPLADLLRVAMGRVVSEGTGQKASNDWVASGGKTGTAQIAGEGGYIPGAYMASFLGLVPIDQPRLVILTVLEEPQGYRQYYAAQSSVPLFNRIVRDIRLSSAWLDDAPGGRTAPMPARQFLADVAVPDVLHLSAGKAARRLAQVGLEVAGTESGGRVIEQIPSAGSRVPAGQVVRLTVAGKSTGTQVADVICPDFRGLSNRQVRSLSARLGLALELVGSGYAVKQSPKPGTPLQGNRVSVRMEAPWR